MNRPWLKWTLVVLCVGGVALLVRILIEKGEPESHSGTPNEANAEPELISESGFHFEIHPVARSRQALGDLIGEHAARFEVGKYYRERRPYDDGFLESGTIHFFEISLREGSIEELFGPLKKAWKRKTGQNFRTREGIPYENLSLIHESFPEREKRRIREDHTFCRMALYPDHFFYLSEQSGEGFYILTLDD